MKSYNEILSARAQGLQPSGIRKFFDILDEMEDVVSSDCRTARFYNSVAYT